MMNSKHTTWIICRNSNVKGVIDFYMLISGKHHYLFSQKFKHSFWDFFKNGVRLETALNYRKAKHDAAIINVMRQIHRHIVYLQKTENMQIPGIRNKFAV